ncbi:MAG: integrase [Marinilabiliales bacterium]|nr:MAG: integrase [Marinilabiliales bacterium]
MPLGTFLTYLRTEKRYSVHTLRSYETDLTQFVSYCLEFMSEFTPGKVDHRIIRNWIIELSESGISSKSTNRKLTSLRTYYKYLLRQGLVQQNPMDKISGPKFRKKLPSFLDEASMINLLDNVDFGSGYEAVRDKTIIELLYSAGLRRAELIHLKYLDYNKANSTIKVLGKRNKERIIPLNKKMILTFDLYIKERNKHFGSGEFMFLTSKGKKLYPELVYRVVRRWLSSVSTLEKKSPHVLRHTFATHMLNNGADLNAIKELLGHANLSATQIYTHNSFEKLRSIYKQAHPRA